MTDVQAYKDDGYLLLKQFFAPDEVRAIRLEAQEVFLSLMRHHGIVSQAAVDEPEFERGMYELFERDLAGFTNAGKHAQHLISLHRLALDERICGVLRDLGLEFPSISTRPIMYFNSPKLAKKEVYWRLALHQDWRSMQGSLDSMVVWLPLVDIDTSLGALEIIPGSHKRGLLDAEFGDGYGHIAEEVAPEALVPVEVELGDALFFSSFLLHQSGTNVTDSIRWSCHFRYNNLSERTFVERGLPHPYVYHPQKELITEGFPEHAQVNAIFS